MSLTFSVPLTKRLSPSAWLPPSDGRHRPLCRLTLQKVRTILSSQLYYFGILCNFVYLRLVVFLINFHVHCYLLMYLLNDNCLMFSKFLRPLLFDSYGAIL